MSKAYEMGFHLGLREAQALLKIARQQSLRYDAKVQNNRVAMNSILNFLNKLLEESLRKNAGEYEESIK